MSIAVMLAALFGCQSKGDFKSLNVEEFSTYIAQPDVQLVDVRTSDEYAEGHLPNAANVDVMRSDFEKNAEKAISKEKPVAVYCRSGKRSKKAASILTRKGYKAVELDKGYMSWQQAGKPTTR